MINFLNIDPHSIPGAFWLFFALAIGHALADFPLQGAFLSEAKNRHLGFSPHSDKATPTSTPIPKPNGIWIQALSAHTLIHGGAVWLITGSPVLGLIEVILHWIIDFAKCEGWLGFNADQLLHYLCKASYVLLIYLGVGCI